MTSQPGVRRTALIITAAVLILAAVGVISYQYGRRSPQADPTRTTATTPASIPPATSTTSANPRPSTTQPGLPRGTATAGSGGSRSGPAGLPLRYHHDRVGAVNAATNYLMWMTSLRIADEHTADAMAAASAADAGTEASMIHSFDVLRSGMENLSTAQSDPSRGAYAIRSYSPSAARIYIWAPFVTVATTGARQSLWGITEVRLVWRDGDWKVNRTLVSREGGTAVDPSDASGNPSAAEKQSILSRTPSDPGEITDSAAQSWFEYANAKH